MKLVFGIVAASLLAASAVAQSPVTLPPFGSTFTGGLTRGFYFTCPTQCIVTGIAVPNEASQPFQTIEFYDFGTTPPPAYTATAIGTQLFYDNTSVGGSTVSTNIVLQPGNIYGVLGCCNDVQGGGSAYNSYGAGPFASTIQGMPVTLTRFITQSNIATSNAPKPCSSSTGSIGRVELYISPATGIYAGFTSDVQTGGSPLTVNFTDTSFTSDPGGILAYAWDFDNDGTIDDTVANPTYTYANCGTYDVSLTVFDATGSDTKLEMAYIVTDTVMASFAEALIAPLTMTFTDTSTPTPDSWAWDLDGDGTIDATTQNTAWTYASAAPVNVSLTVSRLCGPSDTITRAVVPLQQLTTGLAANNASGNFGSVMFDLDVLNPDGLLITSLDVQTSTAGPINLDMYVTQGSYNNSNPWLSPDGWVLAGTATGTSTGGGYGVPENIVFGAPVYLPPGLSGVKFHARDYYNMYTTGTGVVPFGNGDAMMTVGTSQYTTATNAFVGTTITPRWFAGTIYYETYNLGGNAGVGLFGAGCNGSLGRSTLSYSGAPVLGTSMTVTVDNLPVDTAVLMNGFSNMGWALGPLPFDASILGAPGCFLRVDPMMNAFLAGSGGTASWSLTIPNWASVAGLNIFQQAVVFDPGFNAAGAIGSDAAALLFGN